MSLESLRRPPDASSRVGVLLMSFGTAATLDDVPAYLASVRGGRPAPDDLVLEFQRRFARVGAIQTSCTARPSRVRAKNHSPAVI